MGLVSIDDLLWILSPCGKRTCIKDGFHDVHTLFYIVVHSVHARCLIKCLLGIFSLVWTPMSTKLWVSHVSSLGTCLDHWLCI